MITEQQYSEVKTKLERIERMLTRLVEKREMVKVGTVKKYTGWNKEEMRRAREQQRIVYERRDDGLWYDISSLHPRYLLNQQHQS